MVEGDSIFSAVIPQKVFGTTITYDVRGVDSVGNDASAYSSFYIKRIAGGAATGYIIAWTGTSTTYLFPMNMYYCYSWTRQLYLANELSPSSGGGLITKLAWQYAYATPYTYTNQTCYFEVVDASVTSITSTSYIDPVVSGATQVWSGTASLSMGWVEFTLNTPFMLPPGKNLLIHWHHKHGTYPGTAYVFNYTTTPANRAVYCQSDASFPSGNTGTLTTMRPNARFYIVGGSDDTNSVALYRIDGPVDSVVAAPSHQSPVIVTIKNKGIGDLDSCLINWTLNGVTKPTYTWRGHLPDDFNATDTIGFYTPSVNLYDTLVIWTSMPNGVYDSTTFDDTLMQVAFGVPDLALGFTVDLGDTAYNTGPFEVVAEIYSRMGAITPSPIYLDVIYRNDTTYSYDTLLMTSMGNNLYRTYIPQHIFGTDIHYSITLIDTLGNTVSIRDSVYLKRVGKASANDSIQIGTSLTGGDCSYPFTVNGGNYNWARQLYYSSAIGNTTQVVTISGIAFVTSYNPVNIRNNTKLYLKATSATSIATSNGFVDPVADGATLVYTGTWSSQLGWNKFMFNIPFILPIGEKLLFYVVDSSYLNICGASSQRVYWGQFCSIYVYG
jgi:hypothetical protein